MAIMKPMPTSALRPFLPALILIASATTLLVWLKLLAIAVSIGEQMSWAFVFAPLAAGACLAAAVGAFYGLMIWRAPR
jgi:hypothetical protein